MSAGPDSSCGAKKGWRRWLNVIGENLPQPIVTLAVGIASIVIAICALNITREALERSQRAWLVPRHFVIEEPFAVGRPTELVLRYGNVGREPAIKVAQQVGAGKLQGHNT